MQTCSFLKIYYECPDNLYSNIQHQLYYFPWFQIHNENPFDIRANHILLSLSNKINFINACNANSSINPSKYMIIPPSKTLYPALNMNQ